MTFSAIHASFGMALYFSILKEEVGYKSKIDVRNLKIFPFFCIVLYSVFKTSLPIKKKTEIWLLKQALNWNRWLHNPRANQNLRIFYFCLTCGSFVLVVNLDKSVNSTDLKASWQMEPQILTLHCHLQFVFKNHWMGPSSLLGGVLLLLHTAWR